MDVVSRPVIDPGIGLNRSLRFIPSYKSVRTVPIFLILTLLLLPVKGLAETITIAVGEWPPYTSEHDPQARIAQNLVSEAFALEGINVAYRYCPWIRCYREAKEGHVDATLPWFYSKKRATAFLFSREPLLRIKDVFFYLKGRDFHWNSIADLKRYRLGGTLGYYDTGFLEASGLTLDVVSSEQLNFRKILRGRIDAYPTSLKVGTYLIHRLFSPAIAARFTHSSKSLDEKRAFVMFPRSAANGFALRRSFDRGLKKLKATGRYDAILDGL